MTKLQQHLESLGACKEACTWAGKKSAKTTWNTCSRPDWLMWWAARTPKNSHQDIVLAACDCARTVLHLIPSNELRPLRAIEAAEKWVKDPTDENRKAARAAARAARATSWEATRGAAWAAEAAAEAAREAKATRAAAWAAWAAAEAARAETNSPKKLCNLIRKRLKQPWEESK